MRIVAWLVGGAFAVVASAANAQPATESHEQHQAARQYQIADKSEKCCCEAMMRKMMMEMMQKNQGTVTVTPKDCSAA